MNFPELSHHQVLVLECIGTAEIKGRYLREELAKKHLKKSGPSFYQMMSRLEEGNFVEGWYEQKIIEGQIIKERVYKMTGKGHQAMIETLDYYRQRLNENGGLLGGLAHV